MKQNLIKRLAIGAALGAMLALPGAAFGDNMPLHEAVKRDNLDAVRLLLELGADVNARDRDGDTPLHEAATWGRPEIARLLLDAGADVNARRDNGDPVLHDAVNTNAEQSRKAKTVRALLDAGADVNARDRIDFPALFHALLWARVRDNAEIVQMLVEAGAEANWESFDLAEVRDPEIKRLLREAGAE